MTKRSLVAYSAHELYQRSYLFEKRLRYSFSVVSD